MCWVSSILESDGNNIKKAKGMNNCEESQTAEGDSLPDEDHTLAGMSHATMAPHLRTAPVSRFECVSALSV